MHPSLNRLYEFGAFRLDPSLPLLVRDGEPVPLPPKALETLAALVERAGEVVRREDLIEAVWRDTIVEENNLSVNISLLRKALGEQQGGEKYIVTIARRGYRFVAPIRLVESETTEVVHARAEHSSATHPQQSMVVAKSELPPVSVMRLGGTQTERVNKQNGMTRRLGLSLTAILVAAIGCVFYLRGRVEEKGSPSVTRVRSVAVLPLRSITPNESDQALALGLADSLITRLGSSRQIVVRPLSSITEYSESEADPLEVGRKLQVDAVLAGSFQRDSNRLRVRTRLLRVTDGSQIWAGTFDEVDADIFKLQDEISRETASALALSLNQLERELILKRYTENVAAYQAYSRGLYLFARRGEDEANISRALTEYRHALEFDPGYALAYSGLADVYSRLANVSGSNEERKQLYEKAKSEALMAVALDENLAEANASLGWINRIYEWNWAESEKHLKKAIALAPNEAHIRRSYVSLLLTLGRFDDALEESRKTVELDPTNTSAYALALTGSRKFDEAIVEYSRILKMNNDQTAWRALAGLYLQQNRYAEAQQLVNQAPPQIRDDFSFQVFEVQLYFCTGDQKKAAAMLHDLETQARSLDGRHVRLAGVYAAVGRIEEAIAELQRGFETRDDRIMWIKSNFSLDPLRSDPRFQAIVRKMNL